MKRRSFSCRGQIRDTKTATGQSLEDMWMAKKPSERQRHEKPRKRSISRFCSKILMFSMWCIEMKGVNASIFFWRQNHGKEKSPMLSHSFAVSWSGFRSMTFQKIQFPTFARPSNRHSKKEYIVNLPGNSPMNVEFKKSPRARRLTMRVSPDGMIHVSVPRFVSIKRAERFVGSQRDWIEKQAKKFSWLEKIEENEIARLREVAKEVLIPRTHELATEHKLKIGHVTIRNQKTRWWSCSSKNNINLNCELMRLSQDLQDYVIMHELAHVRHKNHGPYFWKYLESICPGSKILDRQLKAFKIGFQEQFDK